MIIIGDHIDIAIILRIVNPRILLVVLIVTHLASSNSSCAIGISSMVVISWLWLIYLVVLIR